MVGLRGEIAEVGIAVDEFDGGVGGAVIGEADLEDERREVAAELLARAHGVVVVPGVVGVVAVETVTAAETGTAAGGRTAGVASARAAGTAAAAEAVGKGKGDGELVVEEGGVASLEDRGDVGFRRTVAEVGVTGRAGTGGEDGEQTGGGQKREVANGLGEARHDAVGTGAG